MTMNIGNNTPENNQEVFRRQIRKNFKARMALEIALSRRERKAVNS